MPDRMSGGERHDPTSRYARPPDEEWVPETENTERPETDERPTRRPGEPGRTQPAPPRRRAGDETGRGTPAPNAAPMPDDGLGAPAPGDLSAREARTTEGTAADAWPTAPGAPEAGVPLLPHEERERWEQRMRQIAAGFVDRPRATVEEADRAVEEIAGRFTESVTRRRRTLRMSWEDTDARGPAAETDTEQLRLALRDYRDLARRLLRG